MEPTGNVRLLSISIEHFRSFEYEYVVRFNPRVTAVVGPNWAGKSNILKALMFGLGWSAEAMCVDDLRSLINDNYMKLCEASLDEPCCSVGLVLQVDEKEVNMKRTLYSDRRELYEIDGQQCDAAEFHDRALEYGINVNAQGLILRQGSITNLVGKTPRELSSFIEKMCGSHTLAKNVKDADSKLRQTLASMVNARSELRNLRLTKRRYNNNTATGEIRNKVDENERMLCLAKLWKTDQKIRICQNDIENLPGDEEEIQRLDELKRERVVVQELLEEHTRSVVLGKAALESAQGQLQEISSKEQDLASRYLDTKTQLNDLNARRTRIDNAISSARARHQEALEKLSAAKEMVDSARGSLESLQMDPDILLQLRHLEDKFQKANRNLLKRAELLRDVRQNCVSRCGFISRSQTSREQLAQLIRTELDLLLQRRSTYESTLESLGQDLELIRARTQQLEADYTKVAEEFPSSIGTIQRLTVERDFIRGKSRSTEQRRLIERTLSALRAAFGSHVLGLLGDLVLPCKPAYTTALRSVLREQLLAIVVDSRATMRSCIAHLRRSNQPTAQLLSLPSKAPNARTLPKALLGRAAMFANICQPPATLPFHLQDRVVHLVRSLFDDMVFCDDVHLLPQLAFERVDKLAVVTSDGSIFEKSGVFDSWKKRAKSDNNNNNTSAEDDITERLANAMQQAERSGVLAVKLLRELSYLQQMYSSMTTDQQTLRTRVQWLDQKIDQCNTALQMVQQHIQDTQEEFEQLIQDNRGNDQKLEKLQKLIQKKRSKIFAQFPSRCNCTVEALLKVADANEANIDVSVLTDACDELRMLEFIVRTSQEDISHLEADMANIDLELAPIVEEEQRIHSCTVTAGEELAETQIEIEGVRAELHERKGREMATKNRLSGIVKDMVEARKMIALHRKALNTLRADRARLRSDRASLFGSYMEKLPAKERMDLTGMTFDERVSMQVNYSCLPSDVCNPTSIEKFCKDTEHSISKLNVLLLERHVGLNDAESLDRLRNRCQAAADKLKAATLKAADEQKTLKLLVKKRAEIFTSFLEQLQEKVSEIYSQLTFGGAMSILPGGGVPDPSRVFDGGILLDCRPNGDKFTEFANLSGGQQSQVALALLLAIHACLRLPFLAIDEADAPLSTKHCRILAQYLHGQNQQVVLVSHRSGTLSRPADNGTMGYSVLGVTKTPGVKPGEDDTRIYSVSIDRPANGLPFRDRAPPIRGDRLSREQVAELSSAASVDEISDMVPPSEEPPRAERLAAEE